jgi:hypothetical protein
MDRDPHPEYILANHPHFLVPLMLKDEKMWMWYSICSAHRSHDTECNMCQAGSWCQVRRVRSEEEIERFGGDDEYADG